MTTETDVWEGRPSQLGNIPLFIICLVLSWLIIPLLVMVWVWLDTRLTHYKLTTERLVTTTGVLNRMTNQMELYRVRDYQIEEPFWMRLFGLANIYVISTDRTNMDLEIKAIAGSSNLVALVREQVETLRHSKRRII